MNLFQMSHTLEFEAKVTVMNRVRQVRDRLGESRTDPIENTCKIARNKHNIG